MGAKVDRTAMRIAFSPTLRVAAGLLFAVLLSVVGYQVVRRLNSHGPDVLRKRADGSSRHVGAPRTKRSYLSAEQELPRVPEAACAITVSTLIHASKEVQPPPARHDSIIDLPLTPDPDWPAYILSKKEITS